MRCWSTSPATWPGPGVVRVSAGARVVDAVDAAGRRSAGRGPRSAEPRGQGRRRPTRRGGQDRRAGPGRDRCGRGDGRGDGAPAGPINLNTATAAQLEELPGIGPSLAAAIITERDKRGGFKAVGELQDVRGIGELRYADIKDLVSV